MYAVVSRPNSMSRPTTMSRSNTMSRTTDSSDPAGLLSRPAVGLVGPYRAGSITMPEEMPVRMTLTSEEEEEEGENEASPTPGRENWRLRQGEENMRIADVWPKDWGSTMYHEQHEQDSLNEPAPASQSVTPTSEATRGTGGPGGRGGLLSSADRHSTMLETKEPFCQLWVVLSSLYGQIVLVLMLAFCLTEVMDNSVKLLSLQGIFLMYLYVGSIAVIICIYIWVLIDSCASLQEPPTRRSVSTPPNVTTTVMPANGDAEMASMSLTRFGSLKRAHISRAKTSGTSFYLRIGALAFGLGTLVFNGLEMAMHSMMEGDCLNDVVFVHPVLHGLFTFLQMHFLFVNSQVLVEKFGLAARFGFMHLAATNLALWVRLVVWESGNEWTYFVHLAQGAHRHSIPTPLQLRGFPRSMMLMRPVRDIHNLTYQPISGEHIQQVVALHECLNTNSLGQLWTSSMPFLYPFIVQFSLIAAAVTFIMGQNVGRDRYYKPKQYLSSNKHHHDRGSTTFTVDCGGASKGLFLGLLCLVTGIVVIIIFLVVKEDYDFPADTIFWLTTGTVGAILSLACIMTVLGLWQIRSLSRTGRGPSTLDMLLSNVTSAGVQLYCVFSILVGASGILYDEGPGFTMARRKHTMLVCMSVLQLIQASLQSPLLGEALRRACLTRHQMINKPGRQVITFLLCCNAVLWAYDTFVTQSWLSQELQLRFFGVLAWGVISRLGLPLLVFYRFHSCVLLLEVWKRSYRMNLLDPGN